jgi:hypothetical protein
VIVLGGAGTLLAADPKPGPARAGGPADFRWKFEKGKPFYQEVTTETQQAMKLMGTDLRQRQKQTFYFSWTPKDKDKDGNWTVQLRIEGTVLDCTIGGVKVEFDSSKDLASITPLTDFFRALVGSEFTLTVSPQCQVLRVEGRDEFLKRLVTANQPMEPLLRQLVSNESLKVMADPAFLSLPGRAVRPGDTWARSDKLNLGMIGTFDAAYKYTYAGKDAKSPQLDKIQVEADVKYAAPADSKASPLPFKILSADLKAGGGRGTVLYDPAKGRVVSSEMNIKIEGRLNVEATGNTTDVELSQTQKITTKTSDDNPLSKR